MSNWVRGACICALLTVVGGAAWADDQPDPSQVFIENLTFSGTGCAPGTVLSEVAPDAKSVSIYFDSFVAEAGPHIALTNSVKMCKLALSVHAPAGWSFAIPTVDYHGYMLLDDQVTGTTQATYSFAGSMLQATAQSSWTGPKDDDYVVRDQIGMANLVWSPCTTADRALNINATVRVNNHANPAGTGMLTVDSIDGKVLQVYGLTWRACP
jgi:hypothetical protein